MKIKINLTIFFLFTFFINSFCLPIKTIMESDICVYGASGSGIMAAVAAAREGYSVIIVEPTHKIGGLLGSGFRMQQDVPYADHLGGLTRYFYDVDILQPEPRHHQAAAKHNIMILQTMLDKYGTLIKVITDHRLYNVCISKTSIKEVSFEYAPPGKYGIPIPRRLSDNTITIKSKIFIDASYEGDLMAFSGVSYRIGKESKTDFNESLAGTIISSRFPNISPYKVEGNPESGLLSCITPDPLGIEGEASRFFMGYNFKLAWEPNPSDKFTGIPITVPENKNEDVYELLSRYVKAGYNLTWPHDNFQRGELMTGALPGMQLDYPDGDWSSRSKIWKGFIEHVRTLTDFSGKDVKLTSDCNEDTDGWPLLYIRGGRRMIGEYVMTQRDLQLQTAPPTPIGMGYYHVDIYPNRLVVLSDGTLAQEGDVWEHVSPGPYQIPYGAIIPQKHECGNILVPLCISASHVAYSSVRMEATYMVMGEAAGIAAAIAIQENSAVQDIEREKLTNKLITFGQKIKWDGKGYRMWRYNIFDTPIHRVTRWETHPEEYTINPIEKLWK